MDLSFCTNNFELVQFTLKVDSMDDNLTPAILKNKGAIFISYSPKIIKFALDNFSKKENDNWYYEDHIYKNLGL